MDMQENCEDNDEENWMENWDRRRQMAVVQVLCYVVYVIYMPFLYYNRHNNQSATSSEGKKRKARACEREFKRIKDAINDVAEAIRDGNTIIERTRPHVYSEEEVFAELVNLGIEQHLRYRAYIFLIEDAARVRAFFGYPDEERKDFLIQMLYGLDDP